ncbi:MAG: tryptophan--tRNA ligase [Alphaproteobacteria bacterium]
MTATRVFSGVQPTGNLHLGNYLGAVRNFATLQDSHECIYCVVDMHAITVWQDPAALKQATLEVAAAYLAAGVDPENHIIFNQSQVPGHAELAWALNCVARIGWINRMTQFKDKAGKNREKASVGLYAYPVLQAADILLYKATHVPVGEDQKQHLELARDIAQKFNNDTGAQDFFPLPEILTPPEAARIMSLRDGSAKMSKSDPSDQSRINLTDDADTIAKKIRKARTDSDPLPENKDGLENRPEVKNLINIYSALAGDDAETIIARYAGQDNFSGFKTDLAEIAVSHFGPITAEMSRLMDDKVHIEAVLRDGGARARAIAEPVLRDVYGLIGFVR